MNKKIKYDFDTIVSRAGTQSEKYEALERFYGRSDIEPFWVADMDLPSPSWLVEALNHRVSHPIYGYTEKNKEIFNSIKWWMENEHNVSIHHDNISLSPSVVTTMSMAIQAFSDTNDNIILFSPVYGPFFTTIKSHNRGLIDCPLIVEDNTFKINLKKTSLLIK